MANRIGAIKLYSFMATEMKLKGSELITYAIIYSATNEGDEHRFTGSIKDICEATGYSKSIVIEALKSLVKKNLVEKFEYTENKIKRCAYSTK